MISLHGGELRRSWLIGRYGRRMYRVWAPIEVRVFDRPWDVIEVGFLTDKTSWPPALRWLRWIPCVAEWFADRRDRYDLTGVLHDWLLARRPDLPKWLVDLLYKAALRQRGAPALLAWLFGSVVRLKRKR